MQLPQRLRLEVFIYTTPTSKNSKEIFLLQTLRGNSSDACEIRDPCQHGGICISTDSGPICECRNPDYEGEYCEKGKC